jgi:hypothetical protein
MSKHEPSYQELVGQMRSERHEHERQQRISELAQEHGTIIEQRDATDDVEQWRYLDQEAEALEQEYSQLVPPAPQQPQWSDETRSFVARRADLIGKPNQVYRHLTNEQVGTYIDQFARAKGLQEGSPEYLELLARATDPDGYEPMPTPDDVIKTLNQTSKYGRDLKPKDYNKGVKRLLSEKAKGGYPDR